MTVRKIAQSSLPLPSGILVAVALALSGCGGGADDAPSASPTASTQAAPSPAAEGSLSDAPSESPDADKPARHEAGALSIATTSTSDTPTATDATDITVAADSEGPTMQALGKRSIPTPSITSAAAEATAPAFTVYVSPSGNNAWSGLLSAPNASGTDGPLKTITAAQQTARSRLAAMKAGTATRQPVRVLLAAGEYRIASSLQFSPADSGTVDAPVSYEAITAGTVTISGGVPLSPKVPTTAGVPISFTGYTMDGLGVRGGGQLFINGKRMTLARQPNVNSSWFVQKAVPLSTEPAGKTGREAFEPTSTALSWIAALSADDKSRAIVGVMQSWSGGHHRLSTATTPAGSVRIKPAAAAAFLSFGLSQRFYVENIAAAFDAPGEWLPNLQGASYIPASTEVGQTLSPVLPVLDKLVVVRGDMAGKVWVQHLQFKGLAFTHTRSITPDAGFSDNQAGVEIGAAIEVDGANSIKIEGCNISRTAGYAVWFRQSVRDSSVTNTTMTDLGGGGIKFGMPTQQPTDPVITGNNVATGNRISETGKVYPGSVGVWVGQTFDNTVANNAIFNTTYTGISLGWTWGYNPATSGRNIVADNLLVNIGQGVLSDMGGIYTVGISPGTKITGNVIRDVRGYPDYGAGAWGIYNDEGASQVLVDNNIVIGTESGGYHLNYGRDNSVTRNLFAKGTKYELRVTRTDPLTKLVTDGNVMLPSVKQLFDLYASAPDVLYTTNKVSNQLSTAGVDIAKCGSGCTVSAIGMTTTSDPRVVTLTGIDSTIATRITATGAKAGPLDQGATPAVLVATEAPVIVVAPPTDWAVDIAGSAVGTQPKGLAYAPSGNVSAIGMVSRSDAPNGKCLAFNDSASFKYVYEPYAYASLNHTAGTSTGEVTMVLDANSDLIYEWRDGSNPYKSGPAMQINAKGIYVKGKLIAAAPIGAWFTIRVISPVANGSGTWTLQLVTSTGTKSFSGLNFGTTGWSNLKWVGLISNTAKPSTACFSTIKVTNAV